MKAFTKIYKLAYNKNNQKEKIDLNAIKYGVFNISYILIRNIIKNAVRNIIIHTNFNKRKLYAKDAVIKKLI